MKIFSEKMKEQRSSLGLSQQDVAEKLNVSKSTIFNWEKGKCVPKLRERTELAKYLNVSVDELNDWLSRDSSKAEENIKLSNDSSNSQDETKSTNDLLEKEENEKTWNVTYREIGILLIAIRTIIYAASKIDIVGLLSLGFGMHIIIIVGVTWGVSFGIKRVVPWMNQHAFGKYIGNWICSGATVGR